MNIHEYNKIYTERQNEQKKHAPLYAYFLNFIKT